MLAYDLGLPLRLEEEFGAHNEKKFLELTRKKGVVQAPGMCHLLHKLDCVVVFVSRDEKDIRASEKRIGWNDNERELKKFGLTVGISSEVKKLAWNYQKNLVNHREINYADLKNHPLWVDDHKKFGARQYG